ncbi:unnamed protein product [Paramecium sonneborni]|uniref:Uncharacterized protein n=1 Tax=Paramecium sonneborni TaxID=65129 RepID=A0A8S1KPD9_9CILI|nr:unnamed protein product [Paramecium sonneborni]
MKSELEIEKPSYQQLNDDTQKSNCFFYQEDPITMYNQFIRLYNEEINLINGIKLKEMKPSKVVQFVHYFLHSFLGSFILLILVFIPIVNIIFFFFIGSASYRLNINYLIFKNNISLVIDPFSNMVENQDICVMMKKRYVVFKLDIKETEGLHFAKNVKEMIKNRSNNKNKIEFTIYNQNLKEDYYGYPNHRCTYLVWSIISLIICLIELVLLFIMIIKL